MDMEDGGRSLFLGMCGLILLESLLFLGIGSCSRRGEERAGSSGPGSYNTLKNANLVYTNRSNSADWVENLTNAYSTNKTHR